MYRTEVRPIVNVTPAVKERLETLLHLYAKHSQLYLTSLQSPELRSQCAQFFRYRNSLVEALSLKEKDFKALLAKLEVNREHHRRNLLLFLKENLNSSGPHLSARHYKCSLQECCLTMRTYWDTIAWWVGLRFDELKRLRKKAEDPLPEAHAEYMKWLLKKHSVQFFDLLDYNPKFRNPPLPNIHTGDEEKDKAARSLFATFPQTRKDRCWCANWLHMKIKQARRRIGLPHTRFNPNRVDFDCDCYTSAVEDGVQKVYLMPPQTSGQSIRFPVVLKGVSKIRGTLQLIKDGKDAYSFRVCLPTKVKKQRTEGSLMAADAGLTETATLDNGERHGTEFGSIQMKISDDQNERKKRRNRMEARYRLLKKSKNKKHQAKAARIKKNNLGKKKQKKQYRKEKARLQHYVNTIIKQMLDSQEEPIKELAVENLGPSFKKSIYGKKMNRRLNQWYRGYWLRKLELECRKRGIKLKKVNSCYSSRECPRCGCFHADNRKGESFKCIKCAYEGQSDHVAAINLRNRALGRVKIPLWARPKEAAKILEAQERRLEVALLAGSDDRWRPDFSYRLVNPEETGGAGGQQRANNKS